LDGFVKLTTSVGEFEYVNLANVTKITTGESEDDNSQKWTWIEDVDSTTHGPYVDAPDSILGNS
jgi:hypothetical protein